MMFIAICPLKTAPEYFSKTKIKYFHTIFCITGAYNKLLVQKVHLLVAEPRCILCLTDYHFSASHINKLKEIVIEV